MEANQNKYLWALAALAAVGAAWYFLSDKPKGVSGTPKREYRVVRNNDDLIETVYSKAEALRLAKKYANTHKEVINVFWREGNKTRGIMQVPKKAK